MELINIVRHTAPKPVDTLGEVFYPETDEPTPEGDSRRFTGDGWFSKPPPEVWENKPLLYLSYFSDNPWAAARRIGINVEPFIAKIKYRCEFTASMLHNTYFWFVPNMLFANDTYKWVERCDQWLGLDRSMLVNWEWQRRGFDAERSGREHFPLTKVAESMLGHGYVSGLHPDDGAVTLRPATVNLSDGSYLGGSVWVWYSK